MFRIPALAFLLLLSGAGFASAQEAGEQTPAKEGSALPRVLILGDSISLGYTPVVVEMLKEKAFVTRPRANCQYTDYGLANIETWLGDGKWDVIHFNWGIWDTHYVYDKGGKIVPYGVEVNTPDIRLRNSPEKYKENLAALIKMMQATGATLVWASTTPCREADSIRFANIIAYNEVAKSLMDEQGIAVNDLHALALPNRAAWQQKDKSHFNAEGSRRLGQQVSESIMQAVESRRTAK